MKEPIDVFDYSEKIMKALRRGILLNTNGDKFNSMVISWGHFGIIWGQPTFAVYVRENRYTKAQLETAAYAEALHAELSSTLTRKHISIALHKALY